MTDFRIINMTSTGAEFGFIAFFNVSYQDVILRGFGLRRVETHPTDGRLSLPSLTFGDQRSVTIRAPLRDAIGESAVGMYNKMTGAGLVYAPPPRPSVGDDGMSVVVRLVGSLSSAHQ